MAQLLQNLCKELEGHFESSETLDQLRDSLSVLAEQLQLLITAINQNRLLRDVRSPDIGIASKIKLIECLAREATQIYRNAEAEAATNLALDKEVRRKKRVVRKLKRSSTGNWGTTIDTVTSPVAAKKSPRKSFLRHTLSPIRESIPLPPPPPVQLVRFRMNKTSMSDTSPSIDTDDPLEFDLVPILEPTDSADEEVEGLLKHLGATANTSNAIEVDVVD